MIVIRKDQFLIVRGSPAQGLTTRGRVMQSPMEQLVIFTAPNRYFNIRLMHVSGPMKGIHMQFKCALARKAKIQSTCVCDAYAYPHRKGKGQCQEG